MSSHPSVRARRRERRSNSPALALSLATALAGCAAEPVAWDNTKLRLPPPPAEARLTLDSAAGARFSDAPMPAAVVDLTGICSELVRYAQAGEGEWHAAAWLQKPGGRALLVSARSTDGGFTWHDPVSVDSLDRGARGCQRPAPSIAADSTTSYVHVTYFLDAPEGPGLFFSHSMDNGELFHSPVAIVYGERPSRTRVRASGDMVAVAYEDPNTERTRIGLALSRTMGHIFERRLPVSDKGVMAAYPDVAIRGDLVAVSWMERGADGSSETPATMVVRQGRQQR